MTEHLSHELAEFRGQEEELEPGFFEQSAKGAAPEQVATARRVGEPAPLSFVRADEFLGIEYPDIVPLLGETDDQLVPPASLVLIVGDAGDGKSTLAVDAVAHGGAGRDWIGIKVPRPLRFGVIENEGAADLFQKKLRDKAEQWDADPSWLENVFVHAQPWGAFTLAAHATRSALREFCLAQSIDVVVANPLFGVGGPGAGKPEETSAFVEWLKEVGLWRNVGFWILHHVNKGNEVSGDWNRHADTLVRLERDGDQPRTKLRWVKTRWASTPSETRPARQLLDWVPEHKGFKLCDVELGNQVSDAELQQRLDVYLAEHPGSSMNAIYRAVTGDNARLKRLLEQSEKAGTHCQQAGRRGAKLWSLGSATSEAAETTSLWDETATSEPVEGNPHE